MMIPGDESLAFFREASASFLCASRSDAGNSEDSPVLKGCLSIHVMRDLPVYNMLQPWPGVEANNIEIAKAPTACLMEGPSNFAVQF